MRKVQFNHAVTSLFLFPITISAVLAHNVESFLGCRSRRSRVRHGNQDWISCFLRLLYGIELLVCALEHPSALATWRAALKGQIHEKKRRPAAEHLSECYCSTVIGIPVRSDRPLNSLRSPEDQEFCRTHTRSFWNRCRSMHDFAYPVFHRSSIGPIGVRPNPRILLP